MNSTITLQLYSSMLNISPCDIIANIFQGDKCPVHGLFGLLVLINSPFLYR